MQTAGGGHIHNDIVIRKEKNLNTEVGFFVGWCWLYGK